MKEYNIRAYTIYREACGSLNRLIDRFCGVLRLILNVVLRMIDALRMGKDGSCVSVCEVMDGTR